MLEQTDGMAQALVVVEHEFLELTKDEGAFEGEPAFKPEMLAKAASRLSYLRALDRMAEVMGFDAQRRTELFQRQCDAFWNVANGGPTAVNPLERILRNLAGRNGGPPAPTPGSTPPRPAPLSIPGPGKSR
jgi:hypothetical protein